MKFHLVLFFVTCSLSFTLASYSLSDDFALLVRAQIEMEMKASLFYQTYAHYFESSDQALHGFAKYFYEQSLEEKKHADKLMTYLNQRNVAVKTMKELTEFCAILKIKKLCNLVTGKTDTVPAVDIPLTAVKNAIDLEEQVYDKLEEIAKKTDSQLSHFIEHEYLDEQVQSIKELKDFETQLSKINGNYIGLLLLDRWLLKDKKNEL